MHGTGTCGASPLLYAVAASPPQSFISEATPAPKRVSVQEDPAPPVFLPDHPCACKPVSSLGILSLVLYGLSGYAIYLYRLVKGQPVSIIQTDDQAVQANERL